MGLVHEGSKLWAWTKKGPGRLIPDWTLRRESRQKGARRRGRSKGEEEDCSGMEDGGMRYGVTIGGTFL
jgi:hypothetical protein